MRLNAVLLEKTVTVLAVVLFSGTILPHLVLAGGVLAEGHKAIDPDVPGLLPVFGVLYLLILAPIALRPRLAPRIALASPAVSALILLAFASSLWSIAPEITLRRSIAFLFTTVFGLYLGLRYPLAEAVRLVAVGLSILLVLSLGAVAAWPRIGIDGFLHAGAWKGVFFQKNVTGRAMVWLILCLLWLQAGGFGPRWLLRTLLASAAALLLMSGSGTALLAVVAAALALWAVGRARVDVRALMPLGAALALAGLAAGLAMTVFYEDALALLGRDPTLTGRTELWDHTLASVAERFVQGYGYAAYWYGDHGPAAVYTVGWGISSAHNGAIDVLLDVGIGGLLLVLAIVGRVLVGGFLAARYGAARHDAAWVFAMGCATVLVALSESIFMERHSLNWVLLVMGAVALGRRDAPATFRTGTASPSPVREGIP